MIDAGLHVQEFGSGPAVAFLHGFLGSGDNFWPHAQALQGSHRCLLIDLPGHGRSAWQPAYSLQSLADSVDATLNARGIASADVVGHSLGGKVAASLALRHPARVRRLVLADITLEPAPPRHIPLLEAMLATPLAQLKNREEAEAYLVAAEPVESVRKFLLKSLYRDETGMWKWRQDIAGFLRDYMAILEGDKAISPNQAPTLIIQGSRSDYVTQTGIDLTQKAFPNLTTESLDAGHWVHAEAKEAFLTQLSAFFQI